ncbi:hypothetical protein [Bifidobacterium amazonense]
MIRLNAGWRNVQDGSLRIRGDDPERQYAMRIAVTFAPHTRG